MPGLVLKLRSGDGLIINGAALRVRTRTIVEIPAKADLLYGKQILAPEEATTPARRLYAALQNAYITSAEERFCYLERAVALARDFALATTSPTAQRLAAEIEQSATAGAFYPALRLCRRLIAHEDAVLAAARDASAALTDPTEPSPEGVAP